MSAKW